MMSIYININKEKRIIYKKLKIIGIRNNGVIFGGMVRDEIIATHYKSLYYKYISSLPSNTNISTTFWNKEFHKESIKRLIIPNDMDIYFSHNDMAEVFINEINNFISSLCTGVIKIQELNLYELGENFIHKRIIITLIIGKTITHKGITIKIKIDMIINKSIINSINYIEPPFNFPDFTCNLFVMSKIYGDHYDIRLSMNTGTKLDMMSTVSRSNYQTQIINDLIEGKTEFIRKSIRDNCEYINGCRILKLLERNMKITNLTFREIDKTDIDNICDICQMTVLNNEEPLIEVLTNKYASYIIHKSCFIRYLRNEINKKNRNTENNHIECRCMRRNLFNFKNSYKSSYLF
jgi:hypothetical protein